jgi:hypothetical protein
MSVTIRVKRGTATQWAARTTPLFSGEIGYDLTNKITKIGDGTTLWASLPSIDSSGGSNTGDITFDGVQIIGGGTASGDGYGLGTLELVPDGDITSDQYLIIDPTAPNHIHIRAGGTQDASTADLFLGGERNNVLVSDNGRSVSISTRPEQVVNTYVNANEISNTQFIVSNSANINLGDTLFFVEGGDTVTVNSITPDSPSTGLQTVTAELEGIPAQFTSGGTYIFTHEEPYNNSWIFDSDGYLYGPGEGILLLVEGIYNAKSHLTLQAMGINNKVILDGQNGEFINDASDPENQIATLGDITAANEYTDQAVSSLGDTLDGAYVPISDVGNPEGVASLDINGKIPDSEIPDSIARDSEIITSYSNLLDLPTLFSGDYADLDNKPAIALGAVAWTANHYQLEGGANTRYLAGDIVWDAGNIYVANFDNESLPTSNTQYWSLIGIGNRLNIDGRDIPNILWENILSKPTIPDLTGYATETYVGTAISNLVDTAPETLNTLNELAAALGDDENFATTVSTSIASKLSLSDPAVDYYITNSGSGAYVVNGVDNGLITFEKGKKYRIHINASGHPFWIQTVSGGYSSSNVYSTGITNAGEDVGHIIVELPQNAPDNLYYACEFHSSMKGPISVQYGNTVTTNAQSSSYTIAPIDSGRLIEMSGGGTLTITDSALFPIGFSVDILQTGSSQVTIAGTSFTPNATPGLKLRTQWSSATLIKRALNSWVVLGDLSA